MGTTGVHTVLWRKGEVTDQNFPLDDISEHLQEEDSLVWVDILEPDHGILQKLADELSLDPHAEGRRLRIDSRCVAGDAVPDAFAHVCALPAREAALRYDAGTEIDMTEPERRGTWEVKRPKHWDELPWAERP